MVGTLVVWVDEFLDDGTVGPVGNLNSVNTRLSSSFKLSYGSFNLPASPIGIAICVHEQ
jgi:hypothetical protein